MRHDFAGFEQAAFWLHVVIAVMLLVFLVRDWDPELMEWLRHAGQSITFDSSDFYTASSLPVL
jgi:hypothetical protein